MQKKSFRARRRARQFKREVALAFAIALALIPVVLVSHAVGLILAANMAAKIL